MIVDLASSRGADVADELCSTEKFVAADVTDTAQAEAAACTATETFGQMDLTVNAAAIGPAHRLIARDGQLFPLETFKNTIDVNLLGLFDVVRRSALAMSRNEPGTDGERGLILNVASIAAFDGQIGQAAHTASKGGVTALTIQVARELERQGIRVMCIATGTMDTAMLPGLHDKRHHALLDLNGSPRRLGTAEEFARPCARSWKSVCSMAACYVSMQQPVWRSPI